MQLDSTTTAVLQAVLAIYFSVVVVALVVSLTCLAVVVSVLLKVVKAGAAEPGQTPVPVPAPSSRTEQVAAPQPGPLGACSACGETIDPAFAKIVEVVAHDSEESHVVVACQTCGGRNKLSTEQARLLLPPTA